MDKDVCEWDRLALRGGTAQEGHPNTPLGSQASNQYLKLAFFCSFFPLAKLGQRKSDEGFFWELNVSLCGSGDGAFTTTVHCRPLATDACICVGNGFRNSGLYAWNGKRERETACGSAGVVWRLRRDARARLPGSTGLRGGLSTASTESPESQPP